MVIDIKQRQHDEIQQKLEHFRTLITNVEKLWTEFCDVKKQIKTEIPAIDDAIDDERVYCKKIILYLDKPSKVHMCPYYRRPNNPKCNGCVHEQSKNRKRELFKNELPAATKKMEDYHDSLDIDNLLLMYQKNGGDITEFEQQYKKLKTDFINIQEPINTYKRQNVSKYELLEKKNQQRRFFQYKNTRTR